MKEKAYPLKDLYQEGGELNTINIGLDQIDEISTIRLQMPDDVRSRGNQRNVLETLRQVDRQYQGEIPIMDPVGQMGITDEAFITSYQQYKEISQKIMQNPLKLEENYLVNLERFQQREHIKQAINLLNQQLASTKTMVLSNDWKSMRRVLRRLEFCNENRVLFKGRVACLISTGDELLTTELLFNATFNQLDTEVMVALLSCLVNEENSDKAYPTTPELIASYQILKNTAARFAEIFIQSKLNINQENYISSYSPSMMEAVYAWAKGSSFSEICDICGMFEGSIIRCIRRLHELLKQLRDASIAVGSHDMAKQLENGFKLIEHGIPFAASLYL